MSNTFGHKQTGFRIRGGQSARPLLMGSGWRAPACRIGLTLLAAGWLGCRHPPGEAGRSEAERAAFPAAGGRSAYPLYRNEDCTIFFQRHGELAGQAGAVMDRYVDDIADTGVTALLINTNGRRTLYRSRVWDAFWDGYDPRGPDDQPFLAGIPDAQRVGFRQVVHGAWAVHDQGIDYPARIIARARHHGITPWISLRMNDVHHGADLDHPFHGQFWREGRAFYRRNVKRTDYFAHALDYAHVEVRDYYRALIEETLERYDLDGLELDFLREPYCFSSGEEAAGRVIMTAWLRDIRALVAAASAEKGRTIRLGVRVPSHPETAWGLGLDVVAWAEEGLVDMVTPGPRWATLEFDLPLERWRALLGGAAVELAGGLEGLYRPYPAAEAAFTDPEMVAGAAVNILSAGADACYLFNYFVWDRLPAWIDVFHRMRSLDRLLETPRRVGVTYRDVVAPGESYTPPLPATGSELAFSMRLGPTAAGRYRAELSLIVAPAADDAPETPAVALNGVPCVLRGATPTKAGRLLTYDAPMAALRSPRNRHEVSVRGAGGAAVTVRKVEILLTPDAAGRPRRGDPNEGDDGESGHGRSS